MSINFSIDHKLCISCGKCVKECGRHVGINDSKHVDPDDPKCSSCLHCYTVCPQNAIKLKDVDDRIIPKLELLYSITDESLASFLAYRRSIRRFQSKDVDNSIVEKLIDRARFIPSGGNAHSYEFTVLKNDMIKMRLKDELTKIYKLRSRILNNPVLRTAAKLFVNKQMRGFLKDKNYGGRMKDLIERIYNGDDPFFYNAPIIIVIHSKEQIPTPKEDCVLAGYNICLMAQALGLGTCFVTLAQNAINSSKKCKEILNLSPQDNVNAVVILGYPAVHHQRIAPKPEKQIHWC
jgi:nitroreductase/NAD-dependent dihydropyrimidine dehydrogenase PreA subunit